MYIGGDLTIKSGATFTIKEDAVVRFLEPITLDGNTNNRSDIIVESGGTLKIEKGVVFRSANETGRGTSPGAEGHGIIAETGSTVTMEGLTLVEGVHNLSGKVTVSADISVGSHSITSGVPNPSATLKILEDAEVLFQNDMDVENLGNSSALAEIVVQSGSTLSVAEATLRNVTDDPADPGWYGIYNKGTVVFDNTTLKSGEYCYEKVGTTASVTATDVVFENCGMFAGNRTKTVEENFPTTTQLGIYSTRPELDSFGSVAWSKEESDNLSEFVIRTVTTDQVLTFSSSPNFENKIAHNVTLKAVATSNNKTVATATQYVTINITDVPEGTDIGTPNVYLDRETATQRRVKVQLTGAQEPKTQVVLYRISYVDGEGVKHWQTGDSSWWMKMYVSPTSGYSTWFNQGGTVEWNIDDDRTYTVEAKAGRCKSGRETQCAPDLTHSGDRVGDEDNYDFGPVGTFTHEIPARTESLTISGDRSITIWNDFRSNILHTYTAADASGTTITSGLTWSVVGNPTGFDIDETGALFFTSNRPYYVSGGTNEYTVKIKATGTNRVSPEFTVTITLKNDVEGVVVYFDGTEWDNEADTPQVGVPFKARLLDPDNPHTFRWRWLRHRKTNAGSDTFVLTQNFAEVSSPGVSISTYTPVEADVGHELSVDVQYTDDRKKQSAKPEHPSGTKKRTNPTIAAATTPDSPGSVSFSPDPPVKNKTLTATLTDDDGVEATNPAPVWSWVRVVSGSDDVTLTGTTNTYEVVSGDVGHQIQATVAYTDPNGQHTVSGTTGIVVQDALGSLTLSPDPPIATRTLTATLSDDDDVEEVDPAPAWTWERVTSDDTQTLSGTNNTYEVVGDDVGHKIKATVAYTDPFGEHTVSGTSGTVLAAPRPGRIEFEFENTDPAAVPQEEKLVTASVSDDNGTDSVIWGTWVRVDGSRKTTLTSTDATDGNATYTPVAADVGKRLEATANYTDAFGSQTATGTTGVVDRRPDTVGEIDLSHSTPPRVTHQMTATLRDRDKPRMNHAIWRWDRLGASGASGDGVTGAGDQGNTYTPGSRDLGYRIQVTVNYTDDYGNQTVRKATEDLVAASGCVVTISEVSMTDVPEDTTPTVGVYGASANSLCRSLKWGLTGSDAASFELRTVSGESDQRSLHFLSAPDYETKRIYSVTINALDPSGAGGTHPRVVRVTNVNEPPTVEGSSAVEIAEGPDRYVAEYTVRDPDLPDDTITWSRKGADPTHFNLSAGSADNKRKLHFNVDPNYESRNRYTLDVKVTDAAGASDQVTVTVTVGNEDDPGVVTISPSSPRVGETASAVLTDEDGGIRGDPWDWSSEAADSQGGAQGAVGNNLPVWKGAVGRHLVASRTYRDNHGSGKSASGRSTGLVRPNTPKTPPDFEAARGHGKVTLSWGAADDQGAAIERYETRYLEGLEWSSWSPVSGGGSARSRAITGLTNGTSYTFEVRAVNSVDPGPAGQATATPAGPPGPPSLTATRGNGQVTLRWGAASSNGSTVTSYEYRRSTTSGWTGWSTVSGGGNARSQTVTSLSNGTSYTFEVKAKNGVGYGSAASRSATPAGPPGTPSLTATRGNGQVSLSWSAASSNGSTVTSYETRYLEGLEWSSWSTVSGGGGARSRTIGSLRNGTSYTFEVKAKNGVGYGSAASRSATPAGLPGKPQGVGTNRDGTSITISWSAASTNGSAIERYEVDELEGITWLGWTSAGTSTSYTKTSASTSRAYTFRVRAKNAVGYGSSVEVTSPVLGPGGQAGPKLAVAGLASVPDSVLAAIPAPNPFNPSTTLHFQVPEAGPVWLTIHNTSGQIVTTLLHGADLQAGTHARVWDAHDDRGRPAASGLYLYRLSAGPKIFVGKVVLLR